MGAFALFPVLIATVDGIRSVDQDILDELRTMLGGEVERLIDVFLEDTPRLIAALADAKRSGVAVYPIGLNIPFGSVGVRTKLNNLKFTNFVDNL